MCTVSWVHSGDGYHLLCNRDEKCDRPEALPPRIAVSAEGVRYVAPVDAAFGGTWVAANEHGLTLCLLNGSMQRGKGARSRGLLIPSLIGIAFHEEAEGRLQGCGLERFAPFTLAVLDARREARLFTWDGERLSGAAGQSTMPLISSSFDPDGVRHRRRLQFSELAAKHGGRVDAAVLHAFHASHGAVANADSPCMHRPDARTVSFTSVTVRPRRAILRYQPGPPCESRESMGVLLCSRCS